MITEPAQFMTLGSVLLLAGVLVTTGCGAGGTVPEAPPTNGIGMRAAILSYSIGTPCPTRNPMRSTTSGAIAPKKTGAGLRAWAKHPSPAPPYTLTWACTATDVTKDKLVPGVPVIPSASSLYRPKTRPTLSMTSGSQHAHVPDVPILRPSIRRTASIPQTGLYQTPPAVSKPRKSTRRKPLIRSCNLGTSARRNLL